MSLGNKITAVLIIEVLGRPKEHLIETLKKISEEIKAEKDVKVNSKKIHEPALVKNQKDVYSTFMEIEIEVELPIIIARLMFKYMPSNIEIIEPERINLTNLDYGDLLSELTRKIHQYDEVVRVLQMEKKVLENQIKKSEISETKK